MGKKEKEIKRLNSEFYKEYNNNLEGVHIKKERAAADKLQEICDKKDAKTQLVNHVAYRTMSDMKEYTDYQGLELCGCLDITNMENFINFVIQSCDVKNNWSDKKVEKEEVFVKPIIEILVKPTKSSDESVEDIERDTIRIREQCIIDAGEYDLLRDFVDSNYDGVYPPNTDPDELMSMIRKRMIKIARSEQRYYDVVKRFGNYHYENIAKSLK
jgi:hypothetical protein